MLKQAVTQTFYHLAEHDAVLSEMPEAEIRADRRYHFAASIGAAGLVGAGVFLGNKGIDLLPKDGNMYAALRTVATIANYVFIGAGVWLGSHHFAMTQNGTYELRDRAQDVPTDSFDQAA